MNHILLQLCSRLTRLSRVPWGLVFTFFLSLVSVSAQTNSTPETPLPTLTTARQVRHLSPEEAKRPYPIHLSAVVTFIDPSRTIFIQDATGGTFLLAKGLGSEVQPGQLIECEGVSYPGLYVPGITPKKLKVIGQGQLPAAVPVTYAQLAAGQYNYQWVEVSGIVRSVIATNQDRILMQLAVDTGRLDVQVYEPAHTNAFQLIDARVRIHGLAAGFINDKRQLVVPHLRANNFQDVTVDEPAAPDPFALPLSPVVSLLQFTPDGAHGHRVKVTGLVTYQQPGQALFIREQNRGLYIQTSQTNALHPGEVVEVTGFPEMGPFSAFLQDANFKKVGTAPEPSAIRTSAKDVLKGAQDANLITLSAELIEVLGSPNEWVLVLQSDKTLFNARIHRTPEDMSLADLRSGSRLQLTGVCRVEASSYGSSSFSTRPRLFDLLLRSPADMIVIQTPSWWTVQRLSVAVALLLLLVLLAFVWVWQLQRRVQEQTQIIAEKLQAEAAVEERQRIAREFHDTLEQELVGLSLRLDAVAIKVPDAKAREILDVARRLVQRIQTEARHFVWNLRERALEETDLAGALARSVNTVKSHGSIELNLEVKGQPIRLPGVVEHNLLRIGQEAVTNALKHAQAHQVQLEVDYAADLVTLRIKDDGRGFAGDFSTQAQPGHFGLKGMEERARKIGATFRVHSAPNQGTTIEVSVTTQTPPSPKALSSPT